MYKFLFCIKKNRQKIVPNIASFSEFFLECSLLKQGLSEVVVVQWLFTAEVVRSTA
ncbi:hypothetical protein HanIR_Chr07g0311261 [Helianthus annuus]|nr:hypothetical protein HanIR_Chr07g0311261 [Helianthus annuus]